jgi:hypothetical protein
MRFLCNEVYVGIRPATQVYGRSASLIFRSVGGPEIWSRGRLSGFVGAVWEELGIRTGPCGSMMVGFGRVDRSSM